MRRRQVYAARAAAEQAASVPHQPEAALLVLPCVVNGVETVARVVASDGLTADVEIQLPRERKKPGPKPGSKRKQ